MADFHKVKDGKVSAPGFPEGAAVIVQSVEDTRPFQVTADEKAELLEAIRQADAGESEDATSFLNNLRAELDQSI